MATTATTLSSSDNPSVCGDIMTLTATVSAPLDGIPTGSVDLTIDGTPLSLPLDPLGQATVELSFTVGSHPVTAGYPGDAGFDPSVAVPLTQITTAAGSDVAVVAAPGPSVCCEPVTCTILVTPAPPSTGLPTGTVTLSVDSVAEPSAELSGGGATVTVNGLQAGTHTVTAAYAGDDCFLAAVSPPLAQIVNRAATTAVLASTPNPSRCCQPVALTATVTGGGASCTPTGTVTFTTGADGPPQTATINAAGQAMVTVNALTTGNHPVTAVFNGDTCFASSTSPKVDQVVTSTPTATTLSTTPNPSPFGQTVTLTATATPTGPAPGCALTGTVTFVISADGPNLTAPVNASGQGSVTISSLSRGTHSVIAVYGGNSCFTGSTSNPVIHTVT